MIEIKIDLDPVNDGIVSKGKNAQDDGACLVIATNGDYKMIDANEAKNILDALGDDVKLYPFYKSTCVMAYNRRKVINIAGNEFLIGSVLIINPARKEITLNMDDIEDVSKEFFSRLVDIKLGLNQTVTAYEL